MGRPSLAHMSFGCESLATFCDSGRGASTFLSDDQLLELKLLITEGATRVVVCALSSRAEPSPDRKHVLYTCVSYCLSDLCGAYPFIVFRRLSGAAGDACTCCMPVN